MADAPSLFCGDYRTALAHVERVDVDARTVERFWSKAMPEPNTGCWLWMCGTDKDGYGKFQITNFGAGPKQFHVRAHRFSMKLKNGRWPGAYVLHSCDTPCCVNPDHLREGTQKENIADMDRRKQRARGYTKPGQRGDKHPRAKMSESQAREIKRRIESGERKSEIARSMSIPRNWVYNVSADRSWRWL